MTIDFIPLAERSRLIRRVGIEEEAVGTRLTAMGCTDGQGYPCARPLTRADFLAWSGAA
jgi:EAL domain-containing protein (putative c-di-GMP-specific phosphodiesterase class I)